MATTEHKDAAADASEDSKGYVSKLKEGRQRFLAHAIEHSLACGRRTPEDFIRHFPPTAIMQGLEHQPNLRASILVLTTGLKKKIAIKKSWEDSATDLQIALDEQETDAESIVALVDPDDRVRYLNQEKIWSFLTEGAFWKTSSSKKNEAESARNHVAFMLERALEDKLLTHRDIVEGVTVDELSTRLPKAELGRLIQCALAIGEKGTPFTDADLLGTTPPETLAQYVPLPHLWHAVIEPKIALRHGYMGRDALSAESTAFVSEVSAEELIEAVDKPLALVADAGHKGVVAQPATKPRNPFATPTVVGGKPPINVKRPPKLHADGYEPELASSVRKAMGEEEDVTQEFVVAEEDIKVM
jgi:hypothetical protein